MVFSSIEFLFYFFPFFLIVYYLTPNKIKNYVLLTFSLIFYAWGEPIYVFLMIFSTFIDFINGRLLSRNNNDKRRKMYLSIALLINLSLLGFFKYSDFLIENINTLFKLNIGLLNVKLPIGISFYTFQTMSYSIDVYRKKVEPETNYFRYLTYVSMFPQLIAGPIVRYETINSELHSRSISFDKVTHGFKRFLQGLFKKVLIANNIGTLFNIISSSNIEQSSILTLWLGLIAYAIQIYFDFSGYSDMAIGSGEMLGFTFDENFDYPYLSKSIAEFWRRWHISLGTWFRDYLMYPILKSDFIQNIQKKLKEKTNKKIAKKITISIGTTIVFFVTGLWHGASNNFIIWGLYYGLFLIIEEAFLGKFLDNTKHKIINHIYVLIVVLVGYAIFSIEDMGICIKYLSSAFGLNHLPVLNNDFIFYISNYGVILLIGIFFCVPVYKKISLKFKDSAIFNVFEYAMYIVLFICTISYLVTSSYNPFMYFRF